MAVADGAVWLHHDREQVGNEMVGGHDGIVMIADLGHPNDEHGLASPDKLVLACPDEDCPWRSTHPIGGGGLGEDDTRRLQQIFVERMILDGWHPTEATACADDLIAETDGAHRNLLHPQPATQPDPEESTMPTETPEPTSEPEHDLGADIIREIDRTLAAPFKSHLDPLQAKLLDELALTRSVLRQRTNALQRIKRTLEAAAALRDTDVTVA
jgi:hypothetical protein